MLLKTTVFFCLMGLVELRPQNIGDVLEQNGKAEKHETIHEDINDDSALLDNRFRPAATVGKGLQDLKDIDHSLRTVATQLLNTSGNGNYSQLTTKLPLTTKSEKATSDYAYTKVEMKTEPAIPDTTTLVYGRPVNSKFSYFGSSHPGEAMALTEEEIERELNMTKVATSQQNQFTTTGGISTWILLNPPSTSMKNLFENNVSNPQDDKQYVTIEPTVKPTTIKNIVNFSSNINKVLEFLPEFETPATVAINNTNSEQSTTTQKLGISKQNESLTTTSQKPDNKILVTTLKPVPTKRVTVQTSANKNVTTSKATVSSVTTHKPPANRIKSPPKRTTPKPNVNKTDQMFTSKIEKVTLKPVPLVSTEKITPDSSEPPIFVTKLKGTITTTSVKKSNNTVLHANKVQETTIKIKPQNTTNVEQIKNHTKSNTKQPNNVGVSSLKINKPVTEQKLSNELTNKPVLTKVMTSSPPSSTTKRPRNGSKKKKNKSRRRKPTSSSPATTVKTNSSDLIHPGKTDSTLSHPNHVDFQAIQESKIEPESKLPQSNSTKNKPPKNPLTTQIYNFLSREVMPSFGVMSLVGLGLGIASYFLYPFGGAITRRNYAAEPNYKYNMDEYGGNNGQNEEEILKQVFQGMTAHESNMNNNNYKYYHYSGYNEANSDGSKKNTVRYSNNEPGDKPVDNTNVKINYRNFDYKMQDSINPVKTEGNGGSGSITVNSDGNKQFVVGSVLQDYVTTDIPTIESISNNSRQNYYKENNYVSAENDFGNVDTVSSRPDDGYDKLEITSTVVAVEHGPRALKIKRSVDDKNAEIKESVIQVIPLQSAIEDPKENDLSNEIFDIIDSVIPDRNQNLDNNKQNKFMYNKQKDSITISKTTQKPFGMNVLDERVSSEAPKDNKNGTAEETTTSTQSSTTSAESSTRPNESNTTTTNSIAPEPPEKFNIFSFIRNVAEVKFRLGLTLLKHASEGFTKYISHVQKKLNGDT